MAVSTDFTIDRTQGYPEVVLDPRRRAFFELIGFETFSPQDLVFKALDHFRYVHHGSGARFGKSKEGGIEAAYKSLISPKHQTWLIGENYEAAKKEFGYAYEILTVDLPEAIPGFKPKQAAFNQNNPADWYIELPNGSWIKPKTAENLNGLLSEELDLVILCEGSNLPPAAWERRLSQRIVTRFGQVLIPTTAAGFTWIHEEFFLPAVASWAPKNLGYKPVAGYTHTPPSSWWSRQHPDERRRWSSSYFSTITPACDSPYYPVEEFERLLARARAKNEWDTFYEQVIGLFVQRTGLVIKNMEEALISVDELAQRFGWRDGEPPDNWDRVVTMDYGESAPKATLVGAIHPRYACVIWYAEYYETGDDIEQQVRWAKQTLGPRHADARTTMWIVDRSAPIREYVKAGAPVNRSKNTSGMKEVLEAATNRLMRDGRCLIVRERTKTLQWEAARLVRKPQSERPYASTQDKRVEKDDHLCDTLFYGCGALAESLEGRFEAPEEAEKPAWPPDNGMRLKDLKQGPMDLDRFVAGLLGQKTL